MLPFFRGGTYLYGLIAGDEYVRVTGRMVGESILLAGAVTGSLKIILGRARPTNQDDNYNFQYFEFDDDFNSFPSGHTTIAFAISSVIAGRIDRWWAYIGAYGLSALHRLRKNVQKPTLVQRCSFGSSNRHTKWFSSSQCTRKR